MAEGISTRLNMHSASESTTAFTAGDGRRFGFPVGGAFLALGALLLWRGRPIGAEVAAVVGISLLIATLLLPARLGPVYRGWMALAVAISKVTTPLFMGVVYYLVFTPVGWMRRVLGTRTSSASRRADTVWVARDAAARRSDLQRQF